MALVINQYLVSKWDDDGGTMTVRYVVELDDGTFEYGADDTMPANELEQLRNVAASQRRRLEK